MSGVQAERREVDEEKRMTWQMHCGSALKVLRTLPEASVDCCVTSPPYFGQRDYGSEREQLGRNETLECYIERLVAIFEVMFSILKPGGCLWLNLGDSYCNAKGQAHGVDPKNPARRHGLRVLDRPMKGLKPKDLIGVPWQVAFALRASGWWLRSDTVWHKPNAMPGSQLDRPTSAHEYCFLFSNTRRYYFNPGPIREPLSASMLEQMRSRVRWRWSQGLWRGWRAEPQRREATHPNESGRQTARALTAACRL